MTDALTTPDSLSPAERAPLVRRGLWLNYVSIAYNALESVVANIAGLLAGSVSLVSFGVDSAIEVTAAAAAQWRLRPRGPACFAPALRHCHGVSLS